MLVVPPTLSVRSARRSTRGRRSNKSAQMLLSLARKYFLFKVKEGTLAKYAVARFKLEDFPEEPDLKSIVKALPAQHRDSARKRQV